MRLKEINIYLWFKLFIVILWLSQPLISNLSNVCHKEYKEWKSTSIHKKLKLEVLKTYVFSDMLYGRETWK